MYVGRHGVPEGDRAKIVLGAERWKVRFVLSYSRFAISLVH
jgi:hypothetical protein